MTTARIRRGYTLLELALVMALLVLLAGLAYPSLKSWYPYFKMNAAVDAVQTAWVQARTRAIDDGRPYRVAIVPGAGHFRIAPDAPEFWSGEGPGSDRDAFVLADSLPEDVRFVLGPDDGGAPAGGLGQGVAQEVSPDAWQRVVDFLPDGTASEDVEVVLRLEGTRAMKLRLRALTGSITVTRLSVEGQ